ncbi:unnamed protein product, partial [Brassica rapa subsp. trilocularis]
HNSFIFPFLFITTVSYFFVFLATISTSPSYIKIRYSTNLFIKCFKQFNFSHEVTDAFISPIILF